MEWPHLYHCPYSRADVIDAEQLEPTTTSGSSRRNVMMDLESGEGVSRRYKPERVAGRTGTAETGTVWARAEAIGDATKRPDINAATRQTTIRERMRRTSVGSCTTLSNLRAADLSWT